MIQIIQTYPRVFILMANQLDRVIVFAEIGLVGLQESFSLKAIIDLLVRYFLLFVCERACEKEELN
jgi:hypothetical protein